MRTYRIERAWALLCLFGCYYGIFASAPFVTLFFLVFLFHAGHEAGHEHLFASSIANRVFGVLCFSCQMHNYFLLRGAHAEHHTCGREDRAHCLIDHRSKVKSLTAYVEYYALLCGWNYVGFIVAGCLLPFRSFVFRHYPFLRYSFRSALLCELVVLLHIVIVFWSFGLMALLVYSLFALYWGVSQNVAHYALPIGGPHGKYASRTFRVQPALSAAFFGSTFFHLEHHVVPELPSDRLQSAAVSDRVREVIGAQPFVVIGFGGYLKCLVQQFRGPFPAQMPWREFA